MGRLAVLIGHLEEEKVGQLLQVVAIAYAIIPQGIAEGPDFGDDGRGVGLGLGHKGSLLLNCFVEGKNRKLRESACKVVFYLKNSEIEPFISV